MQAKTTDLCSFCGEVNRLLLALVFCTLSLTDHIWLLSFACSLSFPLGENLVIQCESCEPKIPLTQQNQNQEEAPFLSSPSIAAGTAHKCPISCRHWTKALKLLHFFPPSRWGQWLYSRCCLACGHPSPGLEHLHTNTAHIFLSLNTRHTWDPYTHCST